MYKNLNLIVEQLFVGMQRSTIQTIQEKSNIIHYKKRDHIFYDGKQQNTIYILVSGVSATYKLNYKEKKVILFNKPFDILNTSTIFDNVVSTSCEVLVDSYVLSMPSSDFIRLMEKDYKLSFWYMNNMSRDLKRTYRQLKNTSNSLNLEERILSKLWKLANDFGLETNKGVIINFPLSISYLGDVVGSKRETVSRNVKTLVEKGYIIHEKNTFIVVDMDGIARALRNL